MARYWTTMLFLAGGREVIQPLNLVTHWHVQKYRLTQIILRRHEVRVIFSTCQILQPFAHPHTWSKRKVQEVCCFVNFQTAVGTLNHKTTTTVSNQLYFVFLHLHRRSYRRHFHLACVLALTGRTHFQFLCCQKNFSSIYGNSCIKCKQCMSWSDIEFMNWSKSFSVYTVNPTRFVIL